MGTQATTRRRAGNRVVRRLAGVVATAALFLVAAPGTATATPTNPSDAQITQAQQAKADAAEQVGALSAALADAQVAVDAARARSAIALDTFQGKQAEYEAAQTTATEAAVFARQSYVQGSTSPTLEALMTADGPAQMVERAALLEAAGSHQGDVVVRVGAAEQQATAADAAAQTALGQAAALKQEAADALTAAEALEVGARQQAAALASQQASMQQQLQQAQQALLGLEGARVAAQQYAAQQAAAQAAAQRPAAQHVVSTGGSGNSTTTAGAGSSSAVETAIAAAREYLGTIYAWGGGSLSGPSVGWGVDAGIVGFDCSGLTRYAYDQAGISIPRNSSAQYTALPKVSRSDLQRGDLVFWATNTANPSTIHHVAIYLGNGQILEAPQSGSVIRVTSMRWSGFIGGVRPSA
jgi:cell wall-associated NlpC family hydrolase